eukprot:CAMPEP_0198239396 /NCGR_PEP_ID=MMETSP1446-20131203/4811_1 /TAXON_ID=1461542 ORGANISM="Unidentified sp, Strain CCMP2111" /NCGR_SAMPLE_ID=MMETSP1446 /ASSEMBLY_ACC=CAM_ASM_001112 /LENGTH=451 /DNA_ID=CAMNT_0043921977 /DNA_START=3 /DNA_END=1358 /DNA_ORIENTATION=+
MSESRKRMKGPRKHAQEDGEDDVGGNAERSNFASSIGDKIFREAKLQRLEIEREEEERAGINRKADKSYTMHQAVSNAVQKMNDSDDSDDEDIRDGYMEDFDVQVTAEDERVIQAFLDPGAGSAPTRNLADIIAEKLRERTDGSAGHCLDDNIQTAAAAAGLSEKAVEVYKQVGNFLNRYKSGSVPKAFKVIPSLSNWEEVLYITNYEEWSVHAMYEATRIFASNLNAKMAQRFFSLVLLPRVREEIRSQKKLHFALFQALKKATYKPGAFFKGLLLPLCQSGTCTVLEAVIFSAVINRVSIPVLHSSAALLRLSEMSYSGINSFFIKVLLEKRYSLPYKVIDSLVDSFVLFEKEERELPVVWHQSFLCFVQRYKHAISSQDKARLRKLAVRKGHYLIGPEVLREIDHSYSRGEQPKDKQGLAQRAGFGSVSKVVEDPKDFPPIVLMDEDA